MVPVLKHRHISDVKKNIARPRKVAAWFQNVLTEAGAWLLAGIVYFAMIETVLWIAAMFSW